MYIAEISSRSSFQYRPGDIFGAILMIMQKVCGLGTSIRVPSTTSSEEASPVLWK